MDTKKIAEVQYRALLTFTATIPILMTYIVNKGSCCSCKQYKVASFILFLLSCILIIKCLVDLCLYLSKFLSDDSIECDIDDITLANNEFLPTYLGYFFVALSASSLASLVFVYLIVYIFTYLSQTLYFNPFFLCLGYNFYHVKTKSNVKQFVISKREIKTTSNVKFKNLKRINNYTFIDLEEKNNESCNYKN